MKKLYEPNTQLLRILLRENLHFIIGLIILTPILYYIREGKQFVLDFQFVKIMAVIFLLYNLPNIIIYWNYYKENKNTNIELDTESNHMLIAKDGVQKQYKISEIKSSVYHLGVYYKNRIDNARRWKMINSDLAYWDLEFDNGDRYYITNLLVDFLHDDPIVKNTKYRFRMFTYINKSDSKEAVELKQKREKTRIEKFIEQYESKNEKQLTEILENSKSYQKEAVEAAKIVLKNKTLGNNVTEITADSTALNRKIK